MSYYFAWIHENAFGEFVAEKIGHKHFKIPISIVSTGDLTPESGIYLAKSSAIGKFIENGTLPVIPITLVKLLLKERDFQKEILGQYTNDLIDEDIEDDYTDDEEWDQCLHRFLFDCSDVVDVIQGETRHPESHLEWRFKIRHPEYTNLGDESVEKDLINEKISFHEIRKDILSPVRPDPSRSILVPLFGAISFGKKEISLDDYTSEEPRMDLYNRVVHISSPEDIARWKDCFANFFTIVWKEDHPEYIVDQSKGIISRIDPIGIGHGFSRKEIDFSFIDRQGNKATETVVIEE